MRPTRIRLQPRDQQITGWLRSQGFATFEQLQRMFFPSKKACSNRLCHLEHAGYLTSFTALEFFKGRNEFTPILLGLNLHPLTRIFTLSREFRKPIPETNRLLKYHLCLHQLLLNDVRVKLEKAVSGFSFLLNDPQLKTWSLVDAGRRKEFTPDLSFEFERHSLAIELERTLKSQNRYGERFGFYQTSLYTHVHYIYVNEGHLATLLKYSGSDRRFGFSHYLNPTEIFSNTWGYMHLSEWIEKLKAI